MIERFIAMQRVTEPMQWVVLMVAAHMMLNVQSQTSQTNVTAILGNNITLNFTFAPEVPITTDSHIVVHHTVTEPQKVAEYTNSKEGHTFRVNPENNSVSWNITNVTFNHRGEYLASVVANNMIKKSNPVVLTIQEVNTTSTVRSSPPTSAVPKDEDQKSKNDVLIVAIVAVSVIVVTAAVLPYLIWSLSGVKGKQEQQNQQSPSPIVQETASSVSVSATSVVYSVLEFPKRASALSDIIPNDAEYANISYAEKM